MSDRSEIAALAELYAQGHYDECLLQVGENEHGFFFRLRLLCLLHLHRFEEALALGSEWLELHRSLKWETLLVRAMIESQEPMFDALDKSMTQNRVGEACFYSGEMMRLANNETAMEAIYTSSSFGDSPESIFAHAIFTQNGNPRLDGAVGLRQSFAEIQKLIVEGKYDRAISQANTAIRSTGQAGKNHIPYAFALGLKGMAISHQGNKIESIDLLVESVRILEEAGDLKTPLHAAIQNSLGVGFQEIGEHEKALKCYERAIVLYAQHGDEFEKQALLTKDSLAYLHEVQGRFDEALDLMLQIIEETRSIHGPASWETGQALENLAKLHEKRGDVRVGKTLRQEASQAYLDSKGATHRDSLGSLFDLANIEFSAGDRETSSRLLDAIYERISHSSDSEFLDALDEVLRFLSQLLDTGQFAFSAAAYERVNNLVKERLGENSEKSIAIGIELAEKYRQGGSLSNSIELYNELLERATMRNGRISEDVSRILNNRSTAHSDLGNFGDAVKDLLEAIEIDKQMLGEQHENIALSYYNLALAFQGMDNLRQSQHYFERAFSVWDTSDINKFHHGVARGAYAGFFSKH